MQFLCNGYSHVSKTGVCILALLLLLNRSLCATGILQLRRFGCIAIGIAVAIEGFRKADPDSDFDTVFLPGRWYVFRIPGSSKG
jgi:hypothetical protein